MSRAEIDAAGAVEPIGGDALDVDGQIPAVPGPSVGTEHRTVLTPAALRAVLLSLLAEHDEPLSTAQLRSAAHRQLGDDSAPVVHEPVYRGLLVLSRLGQVRHARPAGRHVLWSLTPTGKHAAAHRAGTAD